MAARSGYLTGLLPGLLLIGAVASCLLTTAHDVGAALGVAVFSVVATAQVAVGAGFAVGYRYGFIVAAAGAVIALLAPPAVRPASGVRTTVH